MRSPNKLVALGLLLCLTTSCFGKKQPKGPTDDAQRAATPLSPEEAKAAGITPPEGARILSVKETQKVLDRMSPLLAQVDDTTEFSMREKSLPPPRTGKDIGEVFPPKESLPVPEEEPVGPLSVLRHSPEGQVTLAPEVSVTFSQPMIPVTSVETLDAINPPVKISPAAPGKWRWMGTRTLVFQADGRLPMATDYTVEVPAGTKSESGGVLEKAYTFTFSTPPPQVTRVYPSARSVTDLAPVFFLAFDQKIDPARVLPTIEVKAGQKRYELQLLEGEERDKAAAAIYWLPGEEEGRWMAFRAKEKFPKNTTIHVDVGPGVPSAEGPKKSKNAHIYQFRTYGPMQVVNQYCSWSSQNCAPMQPWQVAFSNPIDGSKFKEQMVKVEPKLADLQVSASGNYLYIYGKSKARTTYKVSISGDLSDLYGQKMEKDAKLTFKVGEAPRSLSAPRSGFVVLDPSGGKNFSVFSINHRELQVSLYKVSPEDWSQYIEYINYSYYDKQRRPAPPGRLISSKKLKVDFVPDEMVETRISLSPALDGNYGQAFIIVEPTVTSPNEWENRGVYAWVQATEIGLAAFADDEEVIGWATSLKDGTPLAGVELSLLGSQSQGLSTGKDGLARIPLVGSNQGVLVARKGEDLAILPRYTYASYGWSKTVRSSTLQWYVVDDRKLYRPGEEVKIKGWLRLIDSGEGGDVMGLPSSIKEVKYTFRDSRGNEITKGELTLNALGGFDTTLKLPDTMNLGNSYLYFSLENPPSSVVGANYYHSIQVQEFRRPEFEVKASASEGPHFVDQKAEVSVKAEYYTGGGLAEAPVTWTVSTAPGHYTPPNRDDYTFGRFIPWWRYSYYYDDYGYNTTYQSHSGKTDASGVHTLPLEFQPLTPPRPLSVSAQATVQDVNRQAWTASTNLLVHPSSLYIGLKSERTFVQKGEPLFIEAIVVDIDGNAIAGKPFLVKAVRQEWKLENGAWVQKEVDPVECKKTSSKSGVRCRFDPKEGGSYRITATVSDEKGRENQSEITAWVAGGKLKPNRSVEKQEVMLIPDKKEYQVGDVAEILVIAPFSPAEGLVTLRRSGIVSSEQFSIQGNSHTLKVKIEEEHLPNLFVQVDLVGSSARTDDKGVPNMKLPPQPAFGTGVIELPIPPRSRTLSVTVTPKEKEVTPGSKTTISLELKDAKGKPVPGAEVALVVVDEAVLALTGYRLPDPLAYFYGKRPAGGEDHHLRASVLLPSIDDVQMQPPSASPALKNGYDGVAAGAPAPAAPADELAMDEEAPKKAKMAEGSRGMAPGGDAGKAINVRTNFDALALFAASLPTDKAGKAEISFQVPDNLTRYRIMAVAVEGEKRFGAGESTLTARLPLMVRPSPPRFLNFGDKFALPVVLQNQTDKPMEVDVALRATNTSLPGGVGYRVHVPANDRVEVQFPLETKMPGIARFQVGAVSGEYADASEFNLPVYTPATTEAFATYGQIDKGALSQTVETPEEVFDAFGGLEITTSSTALSALTDAVLYLQSYPYECAEQVSSRVMSVAALRDVLSAFKAEGLPSPEEMLEAVERDLKKLASMQNNDGGFGFWYRGQESWPFLSIHVAHALARAKNKGFTIPDNLLSGVHNYIRAIEQKIPGWYSKESRQALIAYALYVRDLLGDSDPARARRLIKEAGLDKLSLEAVGWILPTLSKDAGSKSEVEKIRKLLGNRVTETAGKANFVTSYSDGAHVLLHSNRRTDGILLEAMIQDQPESDLIPKVVEGLLAHRKKGRWGNTQENAFILLALDRYFNTYEKITPDFVARAWLGETYAGESTFKGRSTDRKHINIPMKFLAKGEKKKKLILSKEGEGRLYYRIGMQYAPQSLTLKPVDYGFTVSRVYEAVDNPDDVKQDQDGTWRIKAGARVRVRLTMVARSRRYHVALVDPLPAGLEAINPGLATTGSLPRDPKDAKSGYGYWWYRNWFEHQNLRDERAEAFASLLWEGEYTYSYIARATTPGEFIVPPAKAEEMYSPEVFGRSGSDKVIITE